MQRSGLRSLSNPKCRQFANTLMGSNTAFCLVIFGVLGVYCEFIWPGRVWQAVLGSAAAVTGGYFLWRDLPSPLGVNLLGAAALLFLVDAYIDTRFVAGTVATTALAFGFVKLIFGAHGIRPLLAVPWCIAFGAITMMLNWAARRARRNKRA